MILTILRCWLICRSLTLDEGPGLDPRSVQESELEKVCNKMHVKGTKHVNFSLLSMEKEKIMFEFRFEKAMQVKIGVFLHGRLRGISRLMEECLSVAMRMHEKGNLLFSAQSGFLTRKRIEDKTTVMLTLGRQFKEYARVLGFIYKRSQAEIMRVVLEVVLGQMLDKNSYQKNYYINPQFRIQEVHISMLCPYPHIRIHIHPLFPPGCV